jgi:hypothetical protein
MSSNRILIFLMVILIVLFGVIIIVTLNRDQAAPIPPTVETTLQPTIWITQVVTQIVATAPSPTPTQIPTSTQFPTSTLAWDPFSAPLYYPISNCAASRLYKGDMAFVGNLAGVPRISLTDQVFADPGIRELVMGEYLHITSNPVCEQNTVIWEVRAISDDTVGYVKEGDGDTYWLFPASPAIATPRRLRP